MKIFFYVVLTILTLLAVSSGMTKILLLQQDVDFFGKYGFTNPILMAYGAIQLLGGILLVLPKSRVVGAILVAITFLISAVVLVMENNIPLTIVTFICVLLLGFIIKRSYSSVSVSS